MDLRRRGWDEDWEATWTNRAYPENVSRWVVASGEEGQSATCRSVDVRPAVGDWVAVRAGGPRGSVQIIDRLPRRTKFTRGASGRQSREQVVAANVDTVWIVHGVDTPLNAQLWDVDEGQQRKSNARLRQEEVGRIKAIHRSLRDHFKHKHQ